MSEIIEERKKLSSKPLPSTNTFVNPMLTDMYQISMTYAHWLNKKVDDYAIFDLFFRKNPFQGEYCIFAGQDEVIRLLSTFRFTQSDVDYLEEVMPYADKDFFQYLLTLDCSRTKVLAMPDGSICFPREPLLRIEGPLVIGQLLETTLLNLINFPSLIATNAARMRIVAGPSVTLLEFGLRRAQGPDGAISATKYSFVGGFDGSSNVLAGKLTGIPVKGTHAHAYVQSYVNLNELQTTKIKSSADKNIEVEFVALVLEKRKILNYTETNNGELTAFIAYSQAFPYNLLALVDSYDTLISGVPNFLCVAWALYELGYKPTGVRLDSGDLAYLSKETRKLFIRTDKIIGLDIFANLNIVASNDINEDVLSSLKDQGHEINTFGIGTNLVTCQKQPALGCVYKLVEINGVPRIKLSQDIGKLTIPGRKLVHRLFGQDGAPILDLMQTESEPIPVPGQRILCRHPFEEKKRCHVTPTKVEVILHSIWDGPNGGYDEDYINDLTLLNARKRCKEDLEILRTDHTRYMNATPYKISVTQTLYDFIHNLWMAEAPISDLC